MVEDGQLAVVHLVARAVEDTEPAAVIETTDVDVAMRAGTYDAHRDYQPLEFRVGTGSVPPAVESVVRELEPGEERTVVAAPVDAFGPHRDDLVVAFDRSVLEERSDAAVEEGRLVGEEGGTAGWVTDVDEDSVTVDFNHEFAGEPVAFEVRLIEVGEPETAREPDSEPGGEGSLDEEEETRGAGD